ncbi:MAG: hypothetical protein CL910_08970 [Deltaproteobacteria bacterium]|nr:hypothetical protein [Deltaproteobacteria bacterium]
MEEWERVRCRFATWYELAQVRFTQDTGDADYRFSQGHVDYNLAWILITFLGVFGVHRMYIGKWLTGILYLCTLGLLGLGVLYDYWTLNDQITVINRRGA